LVILSDTKRTRTRSSYCCYFCSRLALISLAKEEES
jgi:hypothetical protein